MTKVINLFGAPGAGKTTRALAIAAMLRQINVECQLVTEFVKELAFMAGGDPTKCFITQNCPEFIFGEQLRRMQVVLGQTKVIVTDSPLLLQCYYGAGKGVPSLGKCIMEAHHSFDNFNIFCPLSAQHKFDRAGRFGDVHTSQGIEEDLVDLLDNAWCLPYHIQTSVHVEEIIGTIMAFIMSGNE